MTEYHAYVVGLKGHFLDYKPIEAVDDVDLGRDPSRLGAGADYDQVVLGTHA